MEERKEGRGVEFTVERLEVVEGGCGCHCATCERRDSREAVAVSCNCWVEPRSQIVL